MDTISGLYDQLVTRELKRALDGPFFGLGFFAGY